MRQTDMPEPDYWFVKFDRGGAAADGLRSFSLDG